MRFLLIEDDEEFAHFTAKSLREYGYDVDVEDSGEMGLYRAAEWHYDLIIVDRMLPEIDGLSIVRQLRKKSRVPILMLTALNAVPDRVEGLDCGADDYIGKPVDLSELLARIRALIRRFYGDSTPSLHVGGLELDPHAQEVTLDGENILLSAQEYRTLELMMLHKGRTVTRAQIEERLCPEEGFPRDNTLDVLIHRLRAKLGNDRIKTHRGIGYYVAT